MQSCPAPVASRPKMLLPTMAGIVGMFLCGCLCPAFGESPTMLALEKLPAGQSPAAGTPHWQQMLNPDGTWSVLKLQGVEQPPAAEPGPSLTLPAGTVRWAAILPPVLAKQVDA